MPCGDPGCLKLFDGRLEWTATFLVVSVWQQVPWSSFLEAHCATLFSQLLDDVAVDCALLSEQIDSFYIKLI